MKDFLNYIFSILSKVADNLFTTDLVEATIGSAFGAFGGAYCLWLISRKKEHDKTLSDINYILAILISHTNSLLNFKSQYALPFCQEMDEILSKLKNPLPHTKNNVLQISANKIFLTIIETKLEVSNLTKKLSLYASVDTKAVLLSIKVKEALDCVYDITLKRNQIINQIELHPDSADKKIPYFLGHTSEDGKTDTTFVDVTHGVLYNIDVALHFIDLLIPRVQNIGKKILPKSFRNRIVKNEFTSGFKEMMPPKNFVKGWVD